MNKSAVIFYTFTSILSVLFVSIILLLLDWPLMAEWPLGAAIYLQLFVFSKFMYTNLEEVIQAKTDKISLENVKSIFLGSYLSHKE